jgi:phospholipid transport system substrate-binding protein
MGSSDGGHWDMTKMRRRQHKSRGLIKRLLLGLLAGALWALPAHGQPEARRVVDAINAALLETMQAADDLGYAGRYARLEPVLRASYNFPFMTRIAVGQHWSELNAEQQAHLVDLFAQMSIANFAARFDGYGGERFEIVGEGAGPRDAVVVESQIVRPADPPVGLNYVLRQFDEGWRIIDVLLDTRFSELARQRAEFAAVLRQGGYPDLVRTLEQKIEELAG